ncbi:uncharacterized protein LOC101458611 [Ceratitis capitata]|uniref:uncharacterized protein LOC101458611 n=1 Tax=Ceratitis capitata TaxID=7213 RepID=UPI000329D024|nr:uncharacterized protein LOC101458611 [Ceratitis capitata]XP_004521266.1 uncharacterized protein LOC101458611 [Ceratitis capitata]
MEEIRENTRNGTKKRERKMQEKWSAEDTMRLIQEIELREGTWNILSTEYRNRKIRKAQWQDVADILKMPPSEVSAKWNSLRSSFRAAFNRKAYMKNAGKAPAMNSIYNSLKFLEPTLNIAENATSYSCNNTQSTLTPPPLLNVPESNVDSFEEIQTLPSTSQESAPKRRLQKYADGYAEIVELALKTLSTSTKTDAWNDLGSFVAFSGQEWAQETPQLAWDFKTELYELVLKYHKKFIREEL